MSALRSSKAADIVINKLKVDTSLNDRTELNIEQIEQLFNLCLKKTYFLYVGAYYQQTQGAATCSPISHIVANMYMEGFEETALRTAPYQPTTWLRHVDDTFVQIHEYNVDSFYKAH